MVEAVMLWNEPNNKSHWDFEIDKDWSVFAGAQFQTAGKSVSKEGGKEAVLDMSKAIVVNIGISYSF